MYGVIRCHISHTNIKIMIQENDIKFVMVSHRNLRNQCHSLSVDSDLGLSMETLTNKTVCGYGFLNKKTYFYIKNDDREFLKIEDLVDAYNEKFKFSFENTDHEVTYKRVIIKKIK